jgi:hypothetical protein
VLEVFFLLEKKEIKIKFEENQMATTYQARNPEARIFADEKQAVYLPLAKEMDYIRDSSKGMAIHFTDAAKATEWCQRAIVWQKHSDAEVRIKWSWKESEDTHKLPGREASSASKTPSTKSKADTQQSKDHGEKHSPGTPSHAGASSTTKGTTKSIQPKVAYDEYMRNFYAEIGPPSGAEGSARQDIVEY